MEINNSLNTEVIDWLSKILQKKVDSSKLAASLTEDYDATSMDIVDIVDTMETKYGLVINNDQIPKIQTVEDILQLIQKGRGEGS